MKPEIGKTYDVNHSRKGKFRIRVTAVTETWVEGEILHGVAGAIMDYNTRGAGEKITVRIEFATFTEVA